MIFNVLDEDSHHCLLNSLFTAYYVTSHCVKVYLRFTLRKCLANKSKLNYGVFIRLSVKVKIA